MFCNSQKHFLQSTDDPFFIFLLEQPSKNSDESFKKQLDTW